MQYIIQDYVPVPESLEERKFQEKIDKIREQKAQDKKMEKFWKKQADEKAVRIKESKFSHSANLDAADLGITFSHEGKAIRVTRQDGDHLASAQASIKKVNFRRNADLDSVQDGKYYGKAKREIIDS